MSDIHIIIDTRESILCRKLNELSKIPFTTSNLDIGDILFKKNEQAILLLERKSYADLANAIPTGRHHEQKARIHAYDCLIKGYLIEDPIVNIKSRIPQSTLDSAILGLIIRDGLYVIHSRSLDMTCQIIAKIYEKLDTYLKERNEITTGNLKYTGPIYAVRKENLNPISCYQAQLSCYPGISSKIANDISSVYPNFATLLQASRTDLSDLVIISEDGKHRKLGVVGKNLWDYLHQIPIIDPIVASAPIIPKKIQIIPKKC